MTNTLLILADGFEEIEALAPLDILRRAKIEVTLAGLDKKFITSSHNVKVETEVTLKDVSNNIYDALILPGGPGTANLQKSPLVSDIVKKHFINSKIIAAICAAPKILNTLGLLKNKKATSFPACREEMNNCIYIEDKVVIAGNIITSRGAGTSLEFGYAILAKLTSNNLTNMLKEKMVFSE